MHESPRLPADARLADASRIPVEFRPRPEVLGPVAAVALGAAARALGERVLQHPAERIRGWAGVAGDGVLVVLGASSELPWVDGVQYLGRDPRASRLLLPTALEPAGMPVQVFEQAILAHAERLAPPLAVLASPGRVLSVAAALPIVRARLEAWLESQR